MAQQKYYVVWKGRKPGIYNNWADCKAQVEGFEQASYKSYPSLIQAKDAFQNPAPKPAYKQSSKQKSVSAFKPKIVALSVDAACSGNPGVMEYRGVWIHDGKQEFISKRYSYGTNNIGEFLAIVHALALMQSANKWYPIYSDSQIAIKWIGQGKCKTKLEQIPETKELYQLIDRAETWLSLHQDRRNWDIRKWETKEWGEIPADFGRK